MGNGAIIPLIIGVLFLLIAIGWMIIIAVSPIAIVNPQDMPQEWWNGIVRNAIIIGPFVLGVLLVIVSIVLSRH